MAVTARSFRRRMSHPPLRRLGRAEGEPNVAQLTVHIQQRLANVASGAESNSCAGAVIAFTLAFLLSELLFWANHLSTCCWSRPPSYSLIDACSRRGKLTQLTARWFLFHIFFSVSDHCCLVFDCRLWSLGNCTYNNGSVSIDGSQSDSSLVQWSAVTVTAVTVTVGYSDSFGNPRFITNKTPLLTVT